MDSFIPLDDCLDRGIYEVQARNFSVGVFNVEKGGFIGIRQKFDNRYLFTEYHHDKHPVVGTARPIRLLGTIADERIELWEEYPGTMCIYCGGLAEYRESAPGWPWEHIEENPNCTGDVNPVGRGNYFPLYDLIEDYDEKLADEREQEKTSEPEIGPIAPQLNLSDLTERVNHLLIALKQVVAPPIAYDIEQAVLAERDAYQAVLADIRRNLVTLRKQMEKNAEIKRAWLEGEET